MKSFSNRFTACALLVPLIAGAQTAEVRDRCIGESVRFFLSNRIDPAPVLAQAAIYECQDKFVTYEMTQRQGLTPAQREGASAMFQAEKDRLQEMYTAVIVRKRAFDAK